MLGKSERLYAIMKSFDGLIMYKERTARKPWGSQDGLRIDPAMISRYHFLASTALFSRANFSKLWLPRSCSFEAMLVR